MSSALTFTSIPLNPSNPLSIRYTLPSGQSFRWKPLESNTWRGVLSNWIVTLRQNDPNELEFATFPATDPAVFTPILMDYFRLDSADLDSLFTRWSTPHEKHDNKHDINLDFAKAAAARKGLRLIRQQPFECAFSFICSQNNNIPRISGMVNGLAKVCSQKGPKNSACIVAWLTIYFL